MHYKNAALCLALLGILAAPALAIELSLEENRAERGNIGYVDMQKIFRTFPETIHAKENFEESIRQAEEDLNAKKMDILRQRAALADMKAQRELLARTPWTFSQPAATTPAAAAPTTAIGSSREALLSVLPGFDAGKSSASPTGGNVLTPAAPFSISTTIATVPIASSAPSVVAISTPVTPVSGGNPAVAALDAQIEQKTRILTLLESEFKTSQASTEQNLLDLESRKTELLLIKINKAVQEIAQQEGISVVVDKNNILYGHNAVDLTDKVIKHLKGGS